MTEPRLPSFPHVDDTDTPATGHEPASTAAIFSRAETAHVAPVESVTTTSPGGRGRWLVALAATLAVVVVIGGVLLAMRPQAGTPYVTAEYAPANTVAYLEARLDLPGDQHDQLATFMSHFPGFADPQAFDEKLDEMLADAVGSSGADLDWTTDVEPWFGGGLAFFSPQAGMAAEAEHSFTVALTVKDRAALDEVLARHAAEPGASADDYNGHQVWTGAADVGGKEVAFAATDEVLLVASSAADIKAALDVRDGRTQGLADDQFYVQQLGRLHADRLATFYFDGRVAGDAPTDAPDALNPETLERMAGIGSMRAVGEVRAQSDHLEIVARTERGPNSPLPPLPANRTTNLAETAPADALAYAEIRDLGGYVGFFLETALEQPAGSGDDPSQLDPRMLEALLGAPVDKYFNFIGDAAFSISRSGEQPSAGMVAIVDDQAVAQQRVDRLVRMIGSAGALGGDFALDEQQHGDATIHVVTLGTGMEVGGSPAQTFSISVANGRLYLGFGDFVTSAMDRAPADSLASNERFRSAVASVGASNAGILYGDIDAFMALSDNEDVESDQQQFAEPLSQLVVVGQVDGSIMVFNANLFVE